MKKRNKFILISFVLICFVLISLFYLNSINYVERSFQNTLSEIEEYRSLCEKAGFNFEVEGELLTPKNNTDEAFSSWNEVILKCYELRNGVKVYYNLESFEEEAGK